MKTNAAHMRAAAEVYAKVLLEAAESSNKVLAIAGEFDELYLTLRGSIELRSVFSDNTVPLETKKAIASEVFAGYSSELIALLGVMIERQELQALGRTHESYTALAEEALGAVIIDVTTVIELDDELRSKIKTKYSEQLGTGVLLREHIDPSLIGGIILSTHGKRIDASVQAQLENARHTLSKI